MTNYDLNRVDGWGSGSNNDIKLSCVDWIDMTSVLKDSHLSQTGLMRFKNLYLNIYNSYFSIGFGALLPSYIFTKISLPLLHRQHSFYKLTGPLFIIYYVFFVHRMTNIQIPRRINTDIFTDESLDGTYVRRELSKKQPFLWANLSKQLYKKGYNFPEMNENCEYQFPSGIMN